MRKLTEEIPPAKERVPTGLTRKKRSPYTQQYLEFEKRLMSKRTCRLPSLGRGIPKASPSNKMNNE